jgi:hypothetical protein
MLKVAIERLIFPWTSLKKRKRDGITRTLSKDSFAKGFQRWLECCQKPKLYKYIFELF